MSDRTRWLMYVLGTSAPELNNLHILDLRIDLVAAAAVAGGHAVAVDAKARHWNLQM